MNPFNFVLTIGFLAFSTIILSLPMVLTNTPNTPTTTATPETDNDTPPHTQPIRQFSFANGAPKNHHCLHHHPHHQPPPSAPVIYRQCLKNHAATLGGHAVDGCGEFMPTSAATPDNPASMTCAACGCHRNFHRRELDEYSPFAPAMSPHFVGFRHPRRSSSSPSPPPPPRPPPPPPPQPTILPYPPASQMLLALSTAAQEDQQVPNQQYTVATPDGKSAEQNLSGRKRFRTKFTREQKERMHSFAESLGWKIQRCNHTAVENFCNEIGVPRAVLKIWLHNNKNTFGNKKDNINIATNLAGDTATNIDDDDENISRRGNGCLNNDGDDEDNNNENRDHNVANGDGSSPSS